VGLGGILGLLGWILEFDLWSPKGDEVLDSHLVIIILKMYDAFFFFLVLYHFIKCLLLWPIKFSFLFFLSLSQTCVSINQVS
jgi:hypothetical protein